MRAFTLARVSTEQQADEGTSLESQRERLAAYPTTRGWEHVGHFDEAGVSAVTIKNRPTLCDILQRLEAGEADALVVTKLDRLSRSLEDWAHMSALATKQGWVLVSIDDGFDLSTSGGRAMANMLAVFAQFEVERMRERVVEGMDRARAQGKQIGRAPAPVPPHVADLCRDLHAQGRSIAEIQSALNDAAPLTHPSHSYSYSQVYRLLKKLQLATNPNQGEAS